MDRRAVAIVVSGIVQGVGFRPYVYGLASRLHLGGFIRNRTGGVLIEVEGEPSTLARFLSERTAEPPPLAQIDAVHCSPRRPRGDSAFRIEPSEADAAGPVLI